MAFPSTYHAPSLRGPLLEDLRALSAELKFQCNEEELQSFSTLMQGVTDSLDRVMKIPDTSFLQVKYPRLPGFHPLHDENHFNAWAWKCDIKGAPQGKLSGKTIVIKDNIAVAGIPMRNGSKILENYIPEFDATIVSRILDAGGHIVGKSAVEDLCCSGSSVTNVDGPIRNPHDETRIAGGSSSGSAALVAGGIVDLAVGGDQGGSIRIPSSFTGIVGLKPTFGLVPYTGAMSIEYTVDHLGPMAKTVTDVALLLEVIAGYDDGRDARQFPAMPIPEYTKQLEEPVRWKKVGLVKEGFDACLEEDVKQIVLQEAKRLSEAGMTVEETSIPHHKDGHDIWMATGGYGMYHCMVKGNGTGSLSRGVYPVSMMETAFRGFNTHPRNLQPVVKFYSLFGEYINRYYGNIFYGKGQNLAIQLTKAYDAALEKYDVLIMPTLTHVATKIPPANCSTEELFKHCLSMVSNTIVFNSTGHPALSINAGFSETNGARLPVGMMIIGKKYDEATVLQVARAYEKLAQEL